MQGKIMLVANTGWYLYNFRLPLARSLRDAGLDVVFVSPPDSYVQRLQDEGFRWIALQLDRKSMNPLGELATIFRLTRIYQREKPSACHHFTVKCVLYGTIAAKLAGVKAVVNAVTGLGHMFIADRPLTRFVRPFVSFLYRKILTARRVQVVFQNIDDFDEFKNRNLIIPEKTTIIRGSGVNLARFRPRPGALDGSPAPTVLFASRLIKEKGLVEFVEAARILKEQDVEANFAVAGNLDEGNPSAISAAQLQEWVTEGVIDYLGHIDRIEEALSPAAIVVLPSYREGTPRILLEAAAMGKPIVATDVPGCREVVKDGHNGFLVAPRDPAALAEGMRKLLQDRALRERMGEASVGLIQDFKEESVIQATMDVYRRTGVRLESASVAS